MFVKFTTDGAPSICNAEATDKRVSDELVGIPVRVALNSRIGFYIREDCRSMPLNIGASYVATRISHNPVPVLGPAVFVSLDTVGSALEVLLDEPALKGHVSHLATAADLTAEQADLIDSLGREGFDISRGDFSGLKPSETDPRCTLRKVLIPAMLEMIEVAAGMLPADYPDARFERVTA